MNLSTIQIINLPILGQSLVDRSFEHIFWLSHNRLIDWPFDFELLFLTEVVVNDVSAGVDSSSSVSVGASLLGSSGTT